MKTNLHTAAYINNEIDKILELDQDSAWEDVGATVLAWFKSIADTEFDGEWYFYKIEDSDCYVIKIVSSEDTWNQICADYGYYQYIVDTEDSKEIVKYYNSDAQIEIKLEFGYDIFSLELVQSIFDDADGKLTSLRCIRNNGEASEVINFIGEYFISIK